MKPFNISHISGALYLSNKVWPERDLATLQRHGIGAIVNLVEDHNYDAPPSMACLHYAFPDGGHVSSRQLQEIYAFIDLYRGRTHVLVHCSAGVSRSAGIVVGQLLRENPGWTWERALDAVNRKRPVWVSIETRESVLAYLGEKALPMPPGEIEAADARTLAQLQGACGGTLREVRSIEWNTRGYLVEAGRIVGLGLYDLDLALFPKTIQRLGMLQELSLCDNRLTALPAGIARLGCLRSLNLSGNRLTALPGEIGELAHLRVLNVARNRLHAIPAGIRKLSGLDCLVLHENCLSVLPEGFGELTGLTELYLQNNRLAGLPAGVVDLSSLRRFSASGNQIRALPGRIADLAQLAALNVAQNRLAALPEGLAKLSGLDNLNVSGNHLEVLPDGIVALDKLRRLNLALNRFGVLPAGIERWLDELRERGAIVIREGIGAELF